MIREKRTEKAELSEKKLYYLMNKLILKYTYFLKLWYEDMVTFFMEEHAACTKELATNQFLTTKEMSGINPSMMTI